ncbi:MAG: cation transporter [Ruminococcus sp.]
MVKTFKLCELDCANCGLKMENAIKKIKGVNDAKVSFMTQKLTIDADEENFDEILKQSQKVCKKIEPDCKIII